MSGKRRSTRTIKRLEITFSARGITYKGITSNLSREGIFIRTVKGLPPGITIDVELYLPSGETLKLQAVVKRTIKTPFQSIKNGMGIEIINPPQKYLEYVDSLQ
ncbi:MAG TPA: hypothetical protein ENH31_08760 [Nitrospirae bacterium]|nr:PilZ domain protein [bacterium BMS3Abin10]GBE38370.1 PilZ domain protein [bacterium BMS3Bbin08]HDH50405.1 hypothetical protein [Nitrospirota bacterium]HDK41205.1 hypothetical protein [Nitrospirota bacterium]HDK82640.1 hypothetical protein [Nitrospirota bacterium]